MALFMNYRAFYDTVVIPQRVEGGFMRIIQGDPNQNFRFQMTVPLFVCISDPMLVNPKCV